MDGAEARLPLSCISGRPICSPLPTIHELLTNAAKANSDKVAVISMHQSASHLSTISRSSVHHPYLKWTFGELLHASHRTAVALASAGVRSGMKIAAFVETNVEYHIIMRAALELNCPFASLNPKTAGNAREARHFFEVLKPAVIVVPGIEVAAKLEQHAYESVEAALVRIACGGAEGYRGGKWQDLGDFVENGDGGDELIEELGFERQLDDVVLIFFTSGTTSLPKGAPLTNRNSSASILGGAETAKPSKNSILCHHLPVFHAYGHNWGMYFHSRGLSVVHPSASFDATSTLEAIRLERCTTFVGVPAIMTALHDHPDFEKTDFSCVEHIDLGSTTILPEFLQLATKDFQAGKVTEAYGMTECGVLWSHTRGAGPSDTYPAPGTKLRICDYETGDILPRGVEGELHIGGDQVIREYLLSEEQGHGPQSAFYDDEEGHWIRTGDQAVMSENSETIVVGRYKDLIIRGGENISPSAIEEVLLKWFGLAAEVVSAPDAIAGEIPIAVTKTGQSGVDFRKIRETLIRELGSSFAVEELISLEDLGMNDFPRTPLGKVKKNNLREAVTIYYQQSKEANESLEPLKATNIDAESLTELWARHLGIHSAHLSSDRNVQDFADSLTISRFAAVVKRCTGLELGLQDILTNPTIDGQVRILNSRKAISKVDYSDIQPSRSGPPLIEDMIHTHGDELRYQRTRKLTASMLSPFDLAWDDVEDVIPLHDSSDRYLKHRRPTGNNHRHGWICKWKTPVEVEQACKQAFAQHPILRSMAIQFDPTLQLHITIRPSLTFFSHVFTHLPPVEDISELQRLAYDDPKLDHACSPGPMMRILITHIKETNCAGMVYIGHHSVFDAVSLSMFVEDLDSFLHEPASQVIERPPFKPWADNFHNLRSSISAQQAVDWHANRLQGIGNRQDALFPVQRAVEWFKGNSEGWIDIKTGLPGPTRHKLDPDSDGVTGLARRASMPDFLTMKAKYGIEVPQILKAALGIVNMRRTKANIAIFGQYQGARTWSFLPEWMARRLPNAIEIAGPTLAFAITTVEIRDEETVTEMLRRLQMEQKELNQWQHAPYYKLLDRLNERGENEGFVMEDFMRRQLFNWLPGGTNAEYKVLEKVQQLSRTDVGILWNCGMVDQSTVQAHASWDDAQLTAKEIGELLDEMMDVAERLTREENWERKVVEVL